MDKISAEEIGKKARALKHCIKILTNIDKKGSAEIILNCTGVKFVVRKDDAMYLKLSTTRAQLEEEVASYEIVKASETPPLSPSTPEDEKIAERKRKKAAYMREYMREYSKKHREKK